MKKKWMGNEVKKCTLYEALEIKLLVILRG